MNISTIYSLLYRRFQIFIENDGLRVFNPGNYHCETLEKLSFGIHCWMKRYLLLSSSSYSTPSTTQSHHTDSPPPSSLLSLQDDYYNNSLTQRIHIPLKTLLLIQSSVTFIWIPGHIGLPHYMIRLIERLKNPPFSYHYQPLSLNRVRPQNRLSFLNCYHRGQPMDKSNS